MKKILSVIGVAVLMFASLLVMQGSTQTASAAGCGAITHLTASDTTSPDNLIVAGRPIKFVLHVDKRDCDGYDYVTDIWGTIEKNNGACRSTIQQVTDGYKLNPNILAGYNPPTQYVDCKAGTENYIVFWRGGITVTSNMAASV